MKTLHRYILNVVAIFAFLLAIPSSQAQSEFGHIEGPTTVNLGSTTSYDYTNYYYSNTFEWFVYYGGTIQGTSPYPYTINVLWDTSGTSFVFVDYEDLQGNFFYDQLEVNVIASAPPAPTVQETNCGNTVLARANPPSNETYYWQSSSTGTSTANSASTITKTSSGTQYLRARNNSSGVWSDSSSSLAYTVNQCANYVHTVIPLIPVGSPSQITSLDDKLEDVAYFDGLGRVIQSVGIRAGGQGQDIKTPVVYDEFGRQAVSYLPYATTTGPLSAYTSSTGLISGLTTYYLSKHPGQLDSSNPNPYSEQRFEASPLGRVLESGTPGKDWLVDPLSDGDHTNKYDYNTNASNEVYEIGYTGPGQSLSLAGYYPQGELLKNTVKNENWVAADGKLNTKDVFTDKGGKKIAEYSYVLEGSVKTLKTYYVYDDPGNMVYVLTPKLFTLLGSGTTISTTHLNDLAFQYVYDTYNRQIEQKVPGKKQWEYMVYDQLDRPILTQDKELKDQGKWLFTKYDALGRPVYSGLFSSTLIRSALQSAVDSYISANTANLANKESRTTTASSIGGVDMDYSNDAYPTTGLEVLSVNYYDNYSFTDGDRPSTPPTILAQTVTTRTKGLPTASWSKTLAASTWTKSYTYYDEKGSAIYVYEKNHLGGYTDSRTKLDFRGKVESSTTIHKRLSGSSALTITDRFEYDHAERPTAHYQIVNNNPEQRIAKMAYDELGMLVKKEIGGTGGVALQTLDYTYDIRGSLTKVNDVDNMGSDLFAYELNYETGEGTNFDAPQYNGNISQMVWKSAKNNIKKSYYYDYDRLSRLVKGRYGEGASLTTNWQKFEVSVSGYDHNGNITGLTRRGSSSGSPIDALTYTYDTGNGNQLMDIADTSTTDGFMNGGNTGDDYGYDDNGNLTQDLNKDISLIEYNHLDLVARVLFTDNKEIEFTYDASGNKLQMKYINGGSTITTDYIGGFQYVNSILKHFPTPEGYVEYNGGTYSNVYTLRDHLGNTRVSFKNTSGSNVVLSSTDYYPMGMAHYGEYVLNSDYNYRYQNKELLLANGYNMYDFGSRMYDPSVGRWFNVDPQNQFASPYLAMGNNWVIATDPNGEIIPLIIIGAGVIGGAINVAANWERIDNFWEGAGHFATGAGTGVASVTLGPAGYAGASILGGGLDEAIQGGGIKEIARGGLQAGAGSIIGLGAGKYVSKFSNLVINNLKITSPLLQGMIGGSIGGSLGGGLTGGIFSFADGGNFTDGFWNGFKSGAVYGGIGGAGQSVVNSYATGFDPFSGRPLGLNKDGTFRRFPDGRDGYPDGFKGKVTEAVFEEGFMFDRIGTDQGSYGSPVGTSIENRALRPGTDVNLKSIFKVNEGFRIEGVKVGKVAPWFGQRGGGTQYLFPHPMEYYISREIISRIE